MVKGLEPKLMAVMSPAQPHRVMHLGTAVSKMSVNVETTCAVHKKLC